MPARANLSGCLRSCCWSKEPLFGEAACFSWRSHHFLHVARTLGFPDDRMCFVLNRASTMAGLSLDDVANALGSHAIQQLPTAGPELTQAINEGRPPVLHQPRSPVTRALHALFQQVQTRTADPAL